MLKTRPSGGCRALLAMLLVLAAGCSSSKKTQQKNKPKRAVVLAIVAGRSITQMNLQRRVDGFAPELRERYRTNIALLCSVLTDMASEAALVVDAHRHGKLRGVTITPSIIRQLRGQVEGRVSQQLRTFKPTADQEQAYYDQHHSRFVLKQRLLARQIIVATKELADKVARLIKAIPSNPHEQKEGVGDFSTLLQKYSVDKNHKGTNGSFGGATAKDARVPEVVYHAGLGLKKYFDVSAPVKSPQGWHVVQLIQKVEGRELTLQEARPTIRAELRRERLAKLLQSALAGLRSKYHTKLFADRVATLPPAADSKKSGAGSKK